MTVERVETTALVIGAGPIGCTFARMLAIDGGHDVLLIDAGPQHAARPGEHLGNNALYQRNLGQFIPIVQGMLNPVSIPSSAGGGVGARDPVSFRPDRPIIRSGHNPRQDPTRNMPGAAVSYNVGGMFTHWTGGTPRFHPTLERPQFIPGEEWDGLYSEGEALLGSRRDIFSKSIRHTVVKEVLENHYAGSLPDGYGVQELPYAGYRKADNDEFVYTAGADTILGPLIDEPETYRRRFQILPQHRAKRLVVERGRVAYAVVEDLMRWRTLHVYADLFFVASNAVLTPQLLWASDIRPDALGRYLTEHTLCFAQVILSRDIVESVRSDLRFATRVGAVESQDPVPIPMHDPPPMLWIPVSDNRLWHCQIHRGAFQYGELPPDVDDRLVVDLRWFGMVDPVRENRVWFEDGYRDKFGMPQPTFEFALCAADRTRSHDMLADMIGVAMALGGFLEGSEPQFMLPGSSLHLQGTHRAGTAPEDSVTDPYSKVWGIDNLYLGGNGSIPTRNAANPSLTSIALALRAVRAILGQRGKKGASAAAARGRRS